MKKTILLSAVVATLFLGGCSNSNSDKITADEVGNVLSVASKRPEAVSSKAYLDEVNKYLNSVNLCTNGMSELVQNISISNTADWQNTLDNITGIMSDYKTIFESESYPANMKQIHDYMLLSASSFVTATTYFKEGVKTQDSDKIQATIVYLTAIKVSIEKINTEVAKLN